MKINFKKISFYVLLGLLLTHPLFAQNSGSIWVKENKPGSAKFEDGSIDKNALTLLDSLMKREDIVVTFLGAADNLPWKGLHENSKLSMAFDQAKKLERALELRKRYGNGEIGITDEPFRGVKVLWAPKPPDIFKMQEEIEKLRASNESILEMLANLQKNQEKQLSAIRDSLSRLAVNENSIKETVIEAPFFDWEVKTGLLAWTAGAPFDLTVPSVGISLKREYWAFDLEGGFTPWSRQDENGRRGDAMVMGAFTLFPRKMLAYKGGLFSGWEFLSKTDNWTMKALGVTAGPSIKWKIFEGFAGYSYSRLSTLTEPDRWVSGIIVHLNIKFLIN